METIANQIQLTLKSISFLYTFEYIWKKYTFVYEYICATAIQGVQSQSLYRFQYIFYNIKKINAGSVTLIVYLVCLLVNAD